MKKSIKLIMGAAAVVALSAGVAGFTASCMMQPKDGNKPLAFEEMFPQNPSYTLAALDAVNMQPIDLTGAAERSVNAVVHIKSTQESKTETVTVRDPFYEFFGDMFGNRGGQQRQVQTPEKVGFGSGVIISKDGYIVTNNHVIEKADIIGVSQGGMIAQFIAIDYPEAVDKLVLAVTVPKGNETIENVVGSWIEFAKDSNFYDLTVDTAEKMYTEDHLKKYRKIYPLLTRLNTPKNPERFIIMAKACITHNAYDELDKIKAPTFIIGAEKDLIVTGDASRVLAEKITDSELYMYENYGHGVFEEAKDFNQRVHEFLLK